MTPEMLKFTLFCVMFVAVLCWSFSTMLAQLLWWDAPWYIYIAYILTLLCVMFIGAFIYELQRK